MKIKGEDKYSYIKIHADIEDHMGVRFNVKTQSKGISANLGGIYIVTSEIVGFLSAFRILLVSKVADKGQPKRGRLLLKYVRNSRRLFF